MTLAKAALVSSHKPLSEVAERAGYRSVSAFSTAFSRAIGCPPTERWPLLGSGHFKVEMCARRSPTCARAYWTFRPSAGRQGGGGYQRFDA
jgi:AraC-like DNA-binding protein